MIVKTQTINEVISLYPNIKEILINNGFKGLDNKFVLNQIGVLSLEEVLINKEISVDLFIDMLNNYIYEDNEDVTLIQNKKNDKELSVIGLLPCPVRIPLLEKLSKMKSFQNVNYDLKAASSGLEWLKEDILNAKTEDDLADIYISAGFDLFFEDDLMKKFKNKNVFKDFYCNISYNNDFNNELINLKDPNCDYSMIAVVPAVFLINTKILGDRPIPKTWNDLLNPIYHRSISLPVSDFDLFNAILIHLYKDLGEEAIIKLGRSLVKNMHPAEMVKSERRNRIKPAISIMPYFFTKMAIPGSVMQAVWPEDGAIISPVFMLTKERKRQEIIEITDMLMSKEVGEILSHQGLFPSVNKDVNNNLDGKPYKWIGWEFINNNDIGDILKKCLILFEKGMNENGSNNS